MKRKCIRMYIMNSQIQGILISFEIHFNGKGNIEKKEHILVSSEAKNDRKEEEETNGDQETRSERTKLV